MTALKAGAVYFAIVFAAGFVFGTIRTLLLAPAVGPLVAVVIELPFMLTIAWFACRWTARRFAVPSRPGARWAMAATAFVLLMIAEFLLAYAFTRVSPQGYLAQYATLSGLVGLAGQIVFATFPPIQARRAGSSDRV